MQEDNCSLAREFLDIDSTNTIIKPEGSGFIAFYTNVTWIANQALKREKKDEVCGAQRQY